MDFDGRVIATVGSSNKKAQALEWDRATHSVLQPGSSIKPLLVYPLAIETKKLYYSSTIKDEPLQKYKYENGRFVAGPNNAYTGYKGNMLLPNAIEWSSNCTAVQAMVLIGGPSVAYEQAVTKMGFSHLTEEDSQNTGGENIPRQIYSAETASIMNRLLSYNVTYSAHTSANYARVSGWDIIGKTGTTDDDKDSWFCGLSPYAVMATWVGNDQPATIQSPCKAIPSQFFSKIMGHYLEGKSQKEYKLSPNLIKAQYNPYSGLIVSTDNLSGRYIGYYTEDNMPSYGSYNYNYNYDYNSDYDGNSYSGNSSSGGGYSSSSGSGSDTSENSSSSSSGSDTGGSESSAAESSGGDASSRPEQPGGNSEPEGQDPGELNASSNE